jgi:hypothetical protein
MRDRSRCPGLGAVTVLTNTVALGSAAINERAIEYKTSCEYANAGYDARAPVR